MPPAPPNGARNLVVVILDSLRYDSWIEASPEVLGTLGPVERRWSYATWTAPSHYNLLMGLLPHTSPPEVYASEYYKQDFLRYSERLGVEGIEFRNMLPSMFVPTYLKHQLGYSTHAQVSMPVLNEHTAINRDFDSYRLMPKHNDMAAMLGEMSLDSDRPSFHLLNVGETHYPYAQARRGPVGVAAHLTACTGSSSASTTPRRPTRPSSSTRPRCASCTGARSTPSSYLDGVFARLFDLLPSNTWVIVTSDHGELFGEDRYFGHGPIAHEKVLEVPFVEGLVP